MPINYVLVEKGKPSDPTIPKKYYAQVKSNGDITLRELSEKIAEISTLSSIDIIAVLEGLLKMIPQELLNGNIVKLGDFGSFYTVITGKGTDSIKDFNNSHIENAVIKFRPGKVINDALKKADFNKIN